MKVYDITPTQTYTCQGCFKSFASNIEIVIEPGFYPSCSSGCDFKIIYRFIKNSGLSNEKLLVYQKKVEKKEKIVPFSRHKAIFSITKYYAKKGLSNIKFMGQWDRDRNNGTTKPTMGQWDKKIIPSYRDDCPMACPKNSFVPKKNLVPRNKEVSRWF